IQPDRAVPLISGEEIASGTEEFGTVAQPRSTWWRIPVLVTVLAILGLVAYFIFRPPVNPAGQTAIPNTSLPNRWQTLKEMPDSGSGMAAVSYEDQIFVIGGLRGGVVSAEVNSFGVASNIWNKKAVKPTPVTATGAVLMGEKIYMPGGQMADGKPTAVLEIYDPRTDQWETAAPMPIALSRFALAAFEGNLYVFGGWDGKNYSAAVYQYKAAEDTWLIREPMSQPRADSAAAPLGTKIILAGGENANGLLQDTWAYFPLREEDGEAGWEKRADLPGKRAEFSLTALAGSLYLAGGHGETADAPTPVLRFDDTADRWETLETSPVPIGNRPGMTANGNFVHIFGGIIGDQHQTEHLAYQAIYT
ncbi:hypothetical protein EG834_18785, partial [bacterium]|nr:hypothetical protein [bacterium]